MNAIVVIMGVAGAGKSTIGSLLATQLHCAFLDADTLHSPANIAKMTRGNALTDSDRAPWLEAIHRQMVVSAERGECLVVACSALKQSYRESLACGLEITWVYLKGSEQLIRRRVQNREHHYMKAAMLASQFADLEEPAEAIVIDVNIAPDVAVRQIISAMGPKQFKAS